MSLEETPAIEIIKGWRSSGNHSRLVDCPACGLDCQRIGITSLVYTFEVCSCGSPEFDYLVEQLWHRDCWTVRESDEASGTVIRGARNLIAAGPIPRTRKFHRSALALIERGLRILDEEGPT